MNTKPTLWDILLQAPDDQINTVIRNQLLLPAKTKEQQLQAIQKLDQLDNTQLSAFIKTIIPVLLKELTGEPYETYPQMTQEEMNKWKMH